jgi:hypothetical protein
MSVCCQPSPFCSHTILAALKLSPAFMYISEAPLQSFVYTFKYIHIHLQYKQQQHACVSVQHITERALCVAVVASNVILNYVTVD